MRKLIYQVAVGNVPDFYKPCMESVHRYAIRIGADYISQGSPLLRIVPKKSQRSENALRLGYLPIFEKEAALAYLGTYDSVAIVDADIYATDGARDVFAAAAGADFAGVLERDLPLLPQYLRKIQQYSNAQFGSLRDVDWKWNVRGAAFYNMGMMVLGRGVRKYLGGQSPKEFIERPEFERFVNGEGAWRWSTDQTLLNWWVKSTGMRTVDLPWAWNALYSYIDPMLLKPAPWFVHFNVAANFPRAGAEIPDIIRSMTA